MKLYQSETDLVSALNTEYISSPERPDLNTHAVLQYSVLIKEPNCKVLHFHLHAFCKTQQGLRLRNSRL